MSNLPTVLVVDDEPEIRCGVKRWLTFAGYSTIEAGDGLQGMAAAYESLPEAILLDVRMPRCDGMETLNALKADIRTHEVPVVMLSASMRDEQKALDAGAKFFLHKPYDGKKLLSAVKAAIGEPN